MSTFFDASWWCGGNRQRGIGRYLDAFFCYECAVPPEERVWIFPDWATAKQRHACVRRYGGKAITVPKEVAGAEYYADWWKSMLAEYEPAAIWLTSPFERPWSLLDMGAVLFEDALPVESIAFDLLPLEFPQTILQQWSESDQKTYKNRLEYLQQVQKIWVISPFVQQQVVGLLHISPAKVQVLEFGLTSDWLEIPKDEVPQVVAQKHPMVVAISGGEWRKNLPGTLEYFARAFSRQHRLVVICQLSWREYWRLQWLAWRLGIAHRVTFAQRVSERQKWRYLFQAEVGLFLSFAEGLGIPLLEYARAAVPRIVISPELEKDGLGEILPAYHEVVVPPKNIV